MSPAQKTLLVSVYIITLDLKDIEGKKRRQQRTRELDGITDSMDMSLSKLWEMMKDSAAVHGVLQSMRSQRVGHG